jgi:hypothetical protein
MRVWTVNYYCVRIEFTLSQEHSTFPEPNEYSIGRVATSSREYHPAALYTIHSAVRIRNFTVEMSRYKHSLYKLGWGIYETRV